ncbi:transposase, partial [Ligilactobacillus animalis]
ANIQHDIMQKFTTQLVEEYDKIVIEDLAVKEMQMTHVASKGLQRSMFGHFRQILGYKCDWNGKKLILADKYYPSTQRCSK